MDRHEKNKVLTRTRRNVEDSTITMPLEQKKEWNGMNEVKQDLEGARLQQQLEQSCWKTNNEKSKLVVGLWKTSRNLEVKFCH